jgi:hypothetical protein
MRKLLFILIGLIILTLSACTKEATGDEKTAEDFVESKGYAITAGKGEVQKYVLVKSKLCGETETISYQQAWGLQTEEPDKYFGKEISIYGFTVKNDTMKKQHKKGKKDGGNVYIMLTGSKVIGGYSYSNDDVVGAYTSIDGKTLEEVTGLSFQQ